MNTEQTGEAMREMLDSIEARWGKEAGAAVREYAVVICGIGTILLGLDYRMSAQAVVQECRRAAQRSEHCAGLLLVSAAAAHVPAAQMGDFVRAAMKVATRPLNDVVIQWRKA